MPGAVYILGGARTPFAIWKRGRTGSGKRAGALAESHPFDLGADACRGALDRAEVAAAEIDALVFGNMYQIGAHGCYGGRYVSLRAGLPETVPSLAVNMACGTGLAALLTASREILSGAARTVLCAGADTPSLVDKEIFSGSFYDEACGQDIGETVEILARERGIDRDAMDAWALESHRRAGASAAFLQEEIVGSGVDDGVLDAPSPGFFAAAKAVRGGAVTGRNTHAIADGGSALVVSGIARAGALGRLVGGKIIGISPARMGVASVPAIRELLREAGRRIEDIDLFEINETFAAQLLLDAQELKIPKEKVNVNGGAVALGHPFAATGGKLVLGLLRELRRRDLKTGVAAICVGGGLGVAVLVERL